MKPLPPTNIKSAAERATELAKVIRQVMPEVREQMLERQGVGKNLKLVRRRRR